MSEKEILDKIEKSAAQEKIPESIEPEQIKRKLKENQKNKVKRRSGITYYGGLYARSQKPARRQGRTDTDGIPDHRRKPRQREVAPQFLRQARPEFHAALRHRPLGVRSLRRVGRKVDVRPQVHGCAAHDVRHRRRRTHRKDFQQGGHQEPLPANH